MSLRSETVGSDHKEMMNQIKVECSDALHSMMTEQIVCAPVCGRDRRDGEVLPTRKVQWIEEQTVEVPLPQSTKYSVEDFTTGASSGSHQVEYYIGPETGTTSSRSLVPMREGRCRGTVPMTQSSTQLDTRKTRPL